MYCTYLTIYSGNKLPPFYIGSTSVSNIDKGYNGSVKSKKYKKIWIDEINNNPELFKTIIISKHKSRKDALKKELFFQRSLNVVKNPMYINQSMAAPNGYFGRNVYKENHPNYGKRGKEVNWYGKKRSKKSKDNYSKSKLGHKNPMASEYILYDNNDKIIIKAKTLNKFMSECDDINLNKSLRNAICKSYKTNTKIDLYRVGKTGPKPKFDEMYHGWYAIKICNGKHQENNGKINKTLRWWYNQEKGEELLSNSSPGKDWINARKP